MTYYNSHQTPAAPTSNLPPPPPPPSSRREAQEARRTTRRRAHADTRDAPAGVADASEYTTVKLKQGRSQFHRNEVDKTQPPITTTKPSKFPSDNPWPQDDYSAVFLDLIHQTPPHAHAVPPFILQTGGHDSHLHQAPPLQSTTTTRTGELRSYSEGEVPRAGGGIYAYSSAAYYPVDGNGHIWNQPPGPRPAVPTGQPWAPVPPTNGNGHIWNQPPHPRWVGPAAPNQHQPYGRAPAAPQPRRSHTLPADPTAAAAAASAPPKYTRDSLSRLSPVTREATLKFGQAILQLAQANANNPWMTDKIKAQQILAYLEPAVCDKESYEVLMASNEPDSQIILDALQAMLDCPGLVANDETRRHFTKAMVRLASKTGLGPRCFVLDGIHQDRDAKPVAIGGFSDVHKVEYQGRVVALKTPNSRQAWGSSAESLMKEAIPWSQVNHPNIIPFYGFYHDVQRECVGLVSPWMENGSLDKYIKKHPNTSRLLLLSDIASGMMHLHEKGIVHGDLKPMNILITPSGTASLTDFGESKVQGNVETASWNGMTTDKLGAGTYCYSAPERLFAQNGERPSVKSDIYSFAGVCYELVSGKAPWSHIRGGPNQWFQVAFAVGKEGKTPEYPSLSRLETLKVGFTDELWHLMQRCWEYEPRNRPEAADLYHHPILRSERDRYPNRKAHQWETLPRFKMEMDILSGRGPWQTAQFRR